MRCRPLLFILVLFLLVASTLADSQITLEPIKNSITLTETASFKLSIINSAKETQRYSLFSFVQGWDIEPSPLKDKVIEIEPGQNKSTTIKARPLEAFNPGLYNLALNIESDLGEKYSQTLTLYVSPEKGLDYLPSIKVIPDFNKKINPQEPQTIKLLLENKNPLNIPELLIKLQSDLPEFNKELPVSLSPLEKKTVEFTLSPNPYQKPGQYFLFFTFEKDGEAVKVLPQPIEILALTPPFQTELTEEKAFLKTTQTLLVHNTGNVKNTQSVTLPTAFWKNLFTETSAQSLKKEGQRFLSWEITLSPDETLLLTAIQNYRYPLYFLIFLLLFLALCLYLRSPLSLHKTALSTQKDATLSALKVTLHLKNLTKKPLKNVEVIDLIPGIADIEKSLELGTLKPQEIKHTKKGTMVKWRLPEIEPKEDRLISYNIKSKLRIVGALRLPRAKVVYGKNKTAYSNLFKISSQT